jgi:hypothetical protein
MSYFEGAAISVRPLFRPAGRRLAIILGALHENAFGLIAVADEDAVDVEIKMHSPNIA